MKKKCKKASRRGHNLRKEKTHGSKSMNREAKLSSQKILDFWQLFIFLFFSPLFVGP